MPLLTLDDYLGLVSSELSPFAMRANTDWIYALLSARERRLFARLAVFAGSFTPEAAEAVGAGGAIATEKEWIATSFDMI